MYTLQVIPSQANNRITPSGRPSTVKMPYRPFPDPTNGRINTCLDTLTHKISTFHQLEHSNVSRDAFNTSYAASIWQDIRTWTSERATIPVTSLIIPAKCGHQSESVLCCMLQHDMKKLAPRSYANFSFLSLSCI
jgi:hypothetical protein